MALLQRWRIERDPGDKLLDDHRPGGAPLLGTVANLETIAEALADWIADQTLVAIDDIVLGPALVFATDAPITVDVVAEMRTDGSIEARSSTHSSPAPHLAATFHLADHFAPAPGFDAPALTPGAVSGEEIYSCLFHGPAYRVIDRAERQGERLFARAAMRLPPLRRGSSASPIAARAIEFGLQAAGLLQLALDGSMAIPLRIARITRFAETDVGGGALLHARTERSTDGTFDIVVGHAGSVVAHIAGYATTPLPFAHDDRAAGVLADRLNRVSR
ncbi:MAG: hypothetical protein ABIQ98_02365 [Sphingomicrobium sp.]